MQRERVTDDIYVFTSDLYAQVTAAVVLTGQGAVLFDTLVFPDEAQQIRQFVQGRLGVPVTYVINSHFHADHTTGTCFFPEARVVAHERCRELLDHRGRESLQQAKVGSVGMHDVDLVLPTVVFDERLTLYVGNKTLEMWTSPGHSPDSIVCRIKEDQVLFAADTLMPIPYFVDGSFDDFLQSLDKLRNGGFDNIVQGHGEVILRGEVEDKIQSDIDYLHQLRDAVDAALLHPVPDQALERIDIESCGKSRILLNGTVEQLHRQNVVTLAKYRREKVQIEYQGE